MIGPHLAVSGVRAITGIAAGSYTIPVRARIYVGGGTLTIDSSDWWSFYVEEVPV
jgi:hypothetical protein